MKSLSLFACSVALASLVACSADSVSNADVENWPSDFSVKEYAEINWDLVTAQMKDSIEYKNSKLSKAKRTIDEDEIDLFFDKEESIKELFTKYVGFADSTWPGFDKLKTGKLYIDFREPLYDYHQIGNTATKDLAYLKKFPVDYNVIQMQYVLIGKVEGRPYRYCKDKESKTLQVADSSQAVAVRTKWDFSANAYCKNKKNGQVYLIP
jgi:hypothetical protein